MVPIATSPIYLQYSSGRDVAAPRVTICLVNSNVLGLCRIFCAPIMGLFVTVGKVNLG